MTLNHEFLISSYNTVFERAISSQSIDIHDGSQLKTLVGGFGFGDTVLELLRHPNVAKVEGTEYVRQVLDWLQAELVQLAPESKNAEH